MRNTFRCRAALLSIPLAGLQTPIRICFLTDLHYGRYVGSVAVSRWVDTALEGHPDLVVVGGDLVNGPKRPLLQELSRLRASLGNFMVWGNHD